MKRAHRSAHRLIWLVLAPVIALALYLAVSHRPAPTISDVPPALITEKAAR